MNQYNTNHQNPQNKGDNHQLATFNFENNNVRIFQDENGQPLFVAKDVATILGYKDTVSAIKQFCKGVVKHHPLITNGGNQNVRVIYEPDLYRLTFGSKLESAVRFQNWIYEEVLPTIRKTGSYAVQPQVAIPTDYEQAIEHLLVQIKQNKQLAIENAELKPKADALDVITHAKGNQNVRDTAKALGINQNKFVAWCLEKDWLYRDDTSRLKAFQHRINQEYMAQKSVIYEGNDGTERVTMQPMFTPKGLARLAQIHCKWVA